jgi:hypothetical protein
LLLPLSGFQKEKRPRASRGAVCLLARTFDSSGKQTRPAPRKREKKQAAKKKVLFHSGFP